MKKLLQYCFMIIIVIDTSFLLAQNNLAEISGYVKDKKTEEALIGATVKVVDTDLGAITDINGFFTIMSIPPSSYTIEVSYVGFQTITKYNVVVRTGGSADLMFELEEETSVLEGVVIVANPFEKLEETPLSIQKLSPEEIATYPGGNNDIAKVAQSLPGVSGSVGGFRNDLIIRGGAPNENVYYLDGIEIPNINHFSTQGSAGGPVGLLNVSFFEGVTLSSSSFGAEYDNVLSGVLQFDQRNGNNRTFKTNIRVSSSESALTLEGPLLKKSNDQARTSFIGSVRRSYLQLLFQALDLPFLPDYWDYQYKITHKVDDYNELIFTGVGSIDDFSINVPSEFDEEQQATLDQLPIIKQWSTTAGLSWKRRLKDGSGFMTTALSTNILNNDFKQFSDNVAQTGLFFDNVSQEQETKLRYKNTKFSGNRTFAWGGSLQYVRYSNDTRNLIDNFTFNNNLSFVRYGAFAQFTTKGLKDRLGFSAGLRLDGNSFMDEGNRIYETLSPRVSFSYQLDQSGKLKANASLGRYFKIPPYTILGFQNNNGDLTNQSVEYIRSDHAVAGLEYLLNPAARISIEGFYKRYTDYPVSVTDSVSLANLGGDFSVLGNEPVASVGLGRTYGLEFLFQQKLTKNFYAILAYTLFRSEFTGFDPDRFVASSWDNRNLVTFTGGYKFGNNWEISTRVRYLSRTPTAPVDQDATLANYPAIIRDFSQQGSINLGSFNQTDLRIDKKWNLKGFTLDVFIELENLFSQQIPQEPVFGLARDDQGIAFDPAQLVEIEDINASTILPTLGIVIDF